MKHEEEFLKHLQVEADLKRESAALGGMMSDGGAGRIEADIRTYNAGIAGEVPEQWAKEYKEFCNKQDPRYGEYIKLKGIFEP